MSRGGEFQRKHGSTTPAAPPSGPQRQPSLGLAGFSWLSAAPVVSFLHLTASLCVKDNRGGGGGAFSGSICLVRADVQPSRYLGITRLLPSV